MVFKEVKSGTKGENVLVLQTALRMLQFLGKDGKPIEIDSEAGANTKFAINEFQKKQKAYGCECCKSNCGTGGVFNTHCWHRLLGVDENA